MWEFLWAHHGRPDHARPQKWFENCQIKAIEARVDGAIAISAAGMREAFRSAYDAGIVSVDVD